MAASWAVGLVEPLLDTLTRVALDEAMDRRCRTEPAWAQAWFAGVLADHVLTLPPGDPWRGLSARLGDLTRGPNPPQADGAVRSDGARFGTVADAADLVWTPGPGLEPTDMAVAALVPGLDPTAAAVLGFAADGHDAAGRALGLMAPQRLFVVGAAAVRWALWRRRAHSRDTDALTMLSAMTWDWRAARLAAGEPLTEQDEQEIAELRHAESAPGT